jgi:hypothetical protein
MRDAWKIAGGTALFVALALAPVWQRAGAQRAERPAPKIARPEARCVAPRELMRVSHMQVLDGWRDAVVRGGASRTATTAEGHQVARSLSGGCLECHPNQREFCDRCHDDLLVRPVCWSCHQEKRERS